MYGDGPASKEENTAERLVPARRKVCTLFHGGGREPPSIRTTGQRAGISKETHNFETKKPDKEGASVWWLIICRLRQEDRRCDRLICV